MKSRSILKNAEVGLAIAKDFPQEGPASLAGNPHAWPGVEVSGFGVATIGPGLEGKKVLTTLL
jgi:hypothetical protein